MAKARPISHCARCTELDIIHEVSQWQWKATTVVQNDRIVQRLLFDPEYPPVDGCYTCRRMAKYLSCRRVHFLPTEIQSTHFRGTSKSLGPHPIALRSWDRPVGRINDKEVYFGVCPPPAFPLMHLAQSSWRVEHVQRVDQRPNWELIRSWLRHCSDQHTACQPRKHSDLGDIRVVDVYRRSITSLPENEDFVACSYVWGKVEQPAIPDDAEFLPEKLGQTMEDAIATVQQLGYRYLWADAICIDQRSRNDKHDQIRLMHHIYHGAVATIIVLDSPDANSGIPGIHEDRSTEQTWARFGDNRMLSRLPSLSDELAQSIWSSRAWTYQEALLSHKRIVFTKNQVHLVCNQMVCSEDALYAESLPHCQDYQALVNPLDFYKIHKFRDDGFETYERLINGYISRDMTKQEDALSAVTGLLQRMEETIVNEGFHYGLPRNNFRQALLWTQVPHSENHRGAGENGRSATRRPVNALPSWSWVGWKLENPMKVEPLRIHAKFLPNLVVCYLDPLRGYAVTKIDVDHWSQFSESDQYHKSEERGHQYFQRILNWMWRTYQREKGATNVVSPTSRSMSYDSALFIDGLILRLPCMKTPSQSSVPFEFSHTYESLFFNSNGRYRNGTDESRLSCIATEIILEDDPFSWPHLSQSPNNDEVIDDGFVNLSDHLPFKNDAAGDEIVEFDFLWVSNQMLQGNTANFSLDDDEFMAELSLIMLVWKEGVAYRAGVVKMRGRWKILEKMIRKYQPRYTSFFLG